MTFQDLHTTLYERYLQGSYAEAMALLNERAGEFPDHEQDIAYWRMCLAGRMNQAEVALTAMAGALEQGFWFSPYMLRHDEDLKVLQGLPEFERMVAICEEPSQKAQADAVPLRITAEPEGGSHGAPLMLALHGNGHNAADEQHQWQPLTRQGWRVAMIQSSQVAGPNQFVWNDVDWAVREVQQHDRQLREEASPAHTIVGGFSMGAGTSIRLAVSGAVSVKGFIAVGPWLPSADELRPYLSAQVPAGLRGYIIIGEEDSECLRVSRDIQALLAEHGIPCELEVHPGMGHVYPPDFGQSLAAALTFILGE